MTRTIHALAGLALLATAAALAEEPPAMFRGGPDHRGVYESAPPHHLSLRWRVETGGPVLSSPVLAGGTVYVGSADHGVYAIDARSGRLRWKTGVGADVTASPAVAGGLVFVLTIEGNLVALDAGSGSKRWSVKTGEYRFAAPGLFGLSPRAEIMPDPWDLFTSSPTVADGRVYFGSGDGWVTALDAATGALRWRFKTGGVVHGAPAVAGDTVYIGSWDSYFYALDARSGRLRWRFKTGDDDALHQMTGIQGSAAVVDGMVYFGCRDGHVYALDAQSGALRWTVATDGSWVVTAPALWQGKLYVTTSDSAQFLALDGQTGRLLYRLPIGLYGFSSVAVAGGHAFFGSFDGALHDVDLAAQQEAGKFRTPASLADAQRLLLPDGKLDEEKVWPGDTLDVQAAGVRGKLFSLGAILSSPIIDQGVVYVGSSDGFLYALGDDES